MEGAEQDFGDLLPVWRKAAGINRADLDKAIISDPEVSAAIEAKRIKVPARFTSHMENKRLRSPDREVCNVLARILNLDPDYVWRISALERIRKADALDFHLEELEKRRQTSAGDPERAPVSESVTKLAQTIEELQVRLARIHREGRVFPNTAGRIDIANAMNRILQAIVPMTARASFVPGTREEHEGRQDALLVGRLEDLFDTPAFLPEAQQVELFESWAKVTRTVWNAWNAALVAQSKAWKASGGPGDSTS